MADWFHSGFKTCSHVVDYPVITSENEQEIDCSDGLKNIFKEPRKVLLVSCVVSFNGSFYGNDRNVRGEVMLSMVQDDGVKRPVGFIPFGGYMYHNDYGYYEGREVINLDIESDYINADADYKKRFTIDVINCSGLEDRCDMKIYVICNMRIKM
uniref:Putative nuclear shuttle protein n=1 Tax=Parsley severe stunt associated virus TaxID=2558055 RepID=A0A6G7BNE8_9VIRU|nr:nuclear shuttle protein [Parsley severe stunt associated virus]QIH29490.1 nuclear shuttle protein [Parsley severe stunt associated virus]